MGKIKTVAVVNGDLPGGHMMINECDFDEDKHKLYQPPEIKEGTVEWYRHALDGLGIEYDADAKKADLKEMYDLVTNG